MERLLEVLLREASASLPPLVACGCDECREARRSGVTEGACRAERARIQAFLASRLRRMRLSGASAHARIVEEAHRFASGRPGAVRAGPAVFAFERRLDEYPVETLS